MTGSFQLDGYVETFSNTSITINGQVVYFDKTTRVEGQIKQGAKVEVEGYYGKDGRFIIKKIKVEKPKSNDSGNGGGGSSGSSDNSDDHSEDSHSSDD